MKRAPAALVTLAALALVALLAYGLTTTGGATTLDDAVAAEERPSAPSLELPRLGGGSGSIEGLEGRPVVVNFWASWCGPCKDEAPALERAHQRLRRAGGTVVGVTVKDASEDSAAFARRYGLTYPSLRDVGDELQDLYGVKGVPETFVLDREGRIVALQRGQVDDDFLVPAVAEALRAGPRATLPDVEDEVMCVVCGVPLNLAEAPQADAERAFIRRRIAEGATKEEVKAALVAELGPDVLALPDAGRGIGWAAYAVPIAFVVALLALAALLLPRWRRRGAEHAHGAPAPARPSPLDEARLDAELARSER